MVRVKYWLAAVAASLMSLAACTSPSVSEGGSLGSGTPVPTSSPYTVRIGPYTQVYSTPLPQDPAQARVIADFRTAQTLWGKSNEALRMVAPVAGYVTGKALSDLNGALKTANSNDYVPAGIERFFSTRVTQISKSGATITTCDDGSKYRTRNLRTGEDLPPPPASQLYILLTWDMVPLAGHWAIANFSVISLPDHRAAVCQP